MDPQGPSSPPVEARCALHAGQPFTAICPRCGTYMCPACTEAGRFSICPACRDRTGITTFPFRRDAWTWGGLFAHSWEAYKRNLGVLLLGTLISGAGLFMLGIVLSLLLVPFAGNMVAMVVIQALGLIPQTLAQAFFTLGMIDLGVRAARGEKPELQQLFSGGPKITGWLVQASVQGAILLPAILLGFAPLGIALALSWEMSATVIAVSALTALVSGVFAAFVLVSLAFANFELVAQPALGGMAALKNAYRIARGERLSVLVGGICLVTLIMLGLMFCLVGALFTTGLASVLFASLYLTLRNGAPDLTD